MVCLGFKPGPQDGRRRQNHGAMVATQSNEMFMLQMELNKKDQMLMEEKNQRMRMETALQVNFNFFVQMRG